MGVFTAWFTAMGLQVFRDVRTRHQAPIPSEFVASGAIFGALSLFSGVDEGLAGVLAWGLLIALALQAGGPQALTARPVAQKSAPAIAGGIGGRVK